MEDYRYSSPGMHGSYFTAGAILPGQTRMSHDRPEEALDDEDLTEDELRARYATYDRGVATALSKLDHNAINYELVVQVRPASLQFYCLVQQTYAIGSTSTSLAIDV
eukprot:scaffold169174_cov20-Prasinocladus_malaysianus.AAC.2